MKGTVVMKKGSPFKFVQLISCDSHVQIDLPVRVVNLILR